MFGEDFEPEIDIKKITESLEPGTYTSVLCEGCGMGAIAKEEDGKITLALPADIKAETIDYKWITLEEFERDYESKYHFKHVTNGEETNQEDVNFSC